VDPALEATGESYAYTKDNPLNETDPTGLCELSQDPQRLPWMKRWCAFLAQRILKADAQVRMLQARFDGLTTELKGLLPPERAVPLINEKLEVQRVGRQEDYVRSLGKQFDELCEPSTALGIKGGECLLDGDLQLPWCGLGGGVGFDRDAGEREFWPDTVE
jgi:hypothetical protein